MSSFLLIFTIISYILGLATALILMMSLGVRHIRLIRILIFFHWGVAILFLITLISKTGDLPSYFSVLAVASGLMLSGIVWKKMPLPQAIKIYFGLYAVTFLLFLYSPSQLFYLISRKMDLYREPVEFRLDTNLYLTEQQSMLKNDRQAIQFKLIRKYGIYNKTLLRNINFEKLPLKVKLLSLNADSVKFMAYTGIQDSVKFALKTGTNTNEIKIKR